MILFPVLILTMAIVAGCIATALVAPLRGAAIIPFCRILLASSLRIGTLARRLIIIRSRLLLLILRVAFHVC